MENEAIRLNLAVEDPVTEQKLGDLFWNMITISDNESFNELVRLQTDALDFKKGAEAINEYLAEQGYQDTTVPVSYTHLASLWSFTGGIILRGYS